MKLLNTIMTAYVVLVISYTQSVAQVVLQGKVTDSLNSEPLTGATIYFPDLRTGSVADAGGMYKVTGLPKGKFLVQVKFLGYETVTEKITLTGEHVLNVSLKPAVTEAHEVVVTGVSSATERNRTPSPVSIVPKSALVESASLGVIDALASRPGVSQITTGAGVSKPVIRGLGYNRVVVVNDGIRQEGQQWGDEHGIEIDEHSVDKVEILKGPASLSYGSDAMAGVINLLTAPTLPQGSMKGEALGNYQSNNGLVAYSANVAGNQKGWVWNARLSSKAAHSYQNKYDGYVYNSGFKEWSASGIAGVNRSWGYSHLHFGAYYITPGIVEGERDSASGKFVKPVAVNDTTEEFVIATHADLLAYRPGVPYQQVNHYKAVLNNSIILGDGRLNAAIGFQQNLRKEFANSHAPNEFELFFHLNTVNYNFQYLFPEKDNLQVAAGVNGMSQSSLNKGEEFLVPEYNLFDIGAYITSRKSYSKFELSAGLRYDTRLQHGEELFLNVTGEKVSSAEPGAVERFRAFDATYKGVSGSAGVTWLVSEKVYAKLNLSRGFRAPNIAETGANGVHEGTIRYEIGNPGLKAESSWQADAALGFSTDHVTAEFDVFSNVISDFIFPVKLNSRSGGDSLSEGLQTFQYVSGKANLMGGEAVIDIHPHPLDWLHFENTFSYVQSLQQGQPDSMKYLPYTPAPKLQSELRADIKKAGKHLKNAYVKIVVENHFVQDKYYSAFGTETQTPGYTLLHVGIGTDIYSSKRKVCSVFMNVNNLTDEAYQSHLSRLKYAPVNYKTGRAGVYNMGRTVSLKVLIPFEIKKG